jgi:hypothetical protein
MPTQPLVQNPPAPTTIEEARAQGLAVAGASISAPLAPKRGPIAGEAGTFVVTVLKDFWKSATIVALRNAVGAAIGIALFGVAMQIVSVNGDLSQINWQTTQKLAIGAIAFSLASAYAAWWKRRDNDPVKQ